jgi:putative nucleotidyltransferase with HDIG domain
LAATLLVVGLPVLAVSLFRELGVVTSPLLLVVVAMLLSVVTSYAGSAFWATRPGAGDTVFGDLMLWGWLRRRRMERQLAGAVELLGLGNASADEAGELLSLTRRTRLLEQLGRALEARSPETHGHSRRVARHAVAIAKRMGLPDEEVARVRTAAAVHDVGKVETPPEILNKPGPLTNGEFAVIKLHPVVGAGMVAKLGDPELTRIVRHHHERLDGTGYPDGLTADRIPLGARIVAVADTFDAVTSTRSYRSARTHREALALLTDVSGTQLDPDAVGAFRAYYSGFRPVAIWALILNGSRQLLATFGDGLRVGNLALAAKAATATAVTVAAGSMTAHALRTNVGSSDVGASKPAANGPTHAPAGAAAVGLANSPGGPSNAGSEQQSGIDSNDSGSGSNAADQGEAGSGSQSGSSQSDGGGSTSTDTPVSTPSGGDAPVSVPGTSTPSTPADSAHDVVDGATHSLPSIPVTVPSPPDAHSVVPHLPGVGNGHR